MDFRIRSALLLYTFASLGIFLVVAPWTPVWEQAARILLGGSLQRWVLSGWARGCISGLGALDLGVAIQVAVELAGGSRRSPEAGTEDD